MSPLFTVLLSFILAILSLLDVPVLLSSALLSLDAMLAPVFDEDFSVEVVVPALVDELLVPVLSELFFEADLFTFLVTCPS